jgi:hypothetical protein
VDLQAGAQGGTAWREGDSLHDVSADPEAQPQGSAEDCRAERNRIKNGVG